MPNLDVSRLKALLNQTSAQQTDPQLYQLLLQIIQALEVLNGQSLR